MHLNQDLKKTNNTTAWMLSGFVMVYVPWMLSKGKMRLFRRRPSISEPQPLAIYPLQGKATGDGSDCKSAAENERRILDDSNYQTVKALPALVLANDSTNSPKSSKKGSFWKIYYGLFQYHSNLSRVIHLCSHRFTFIFEQSWAI